MHALKTQMRGQNQKQAVLNPACFGREASIGGRGCPPIPKANKGLKRVDFV